MTTNSSRSGGGWLAHLAQDVLYKGDAYYKELEAFLKQHENADAITYDNESRLPVEAVYRFKPYQCAVEHLALMQKIADANRERVDDATYEEDK